MPVIRQPLHKRCNVQQLSVLSNDNEHERSRHRKLAAKNSTKYRPPHRSVRSCEVTLLIPSSPLPLPFSRRESYHHLQSYCEIIPFLSIALSNGLFDPTTLLPPTSSTTLAPFTHFIKIQHPSPPLGLTPGLAWSEYHLKTGVYVLNLVVPHPPQLQREEQSTLLTEHQLLLSRDFLSLALPYFCKSEPPSIWAGDLPSADMAHVLITAPPPPPMSWECMESSPSTAAVDIMSIVICYLTFIGGQKSATVIECVDRELDSSGSNIWKDKVKKDGAEVIQRVAIAP